MIESTIEGFLMEIKLEDKAFVEDSNYVLRGSGSGEILLNVRHPDKDFARLSNPKVYEKFLDKHKLVIFTLTAEGFRPSLIVRNWLNSKRRG